MIYILLTHLLLLLLLFVQHESASCALTAWSTGTTILGFRASPNVTILAADGRTTQGGAIASDRTVKLHDVLDVVNATDSWVASDVVDGSETRSSLDSSSPAFVVPGYRHRLVGCSSSDALATCAGAGTSGDVHYIIREVRASCGLDRALGKSITPKVRGPKRQTSSVFAPPLSHPHLHLRHQPKSVLDSFISNTMSGKKSCCLLVGRAGPDSCDCVVVDSGNGVRPVQRCVAMGSGGPYATAYLDNELSRLKGDVDVKAGVELCVNGVLAGIRNDEFSGGHVVVVVLERGAVQRRFVFEKEAVGFSEALARRTAADVPDDDNDAGQLLDGEVLVIKGQEQSERERRELLDYIEN